MIYSGSQLRALIYSGSQPGGGGGRGDIQWQSARGM